MAMAALTRMLPMALAPADALSAASLPLTLTLTAVSIIALATLTSGVLLAYGARTKSPALLPFQSLGRKFLDRQVKRVKLLRKDYITHDVVRLRFALPATTPVLGLPLGKAIKVIIPNIAVGLAEWNPRPEVVRGETTIPGAPRDGGSGEGDLTAEGVWKDEIIRKYTPCSLDCHTGYFELIVKVYAKGHSRFPQGGKASQYMGALEVGQELKVQGPYGHLEYRGRGEWKKYGARRKLGLIAGGSGVTPMLQLIQAVLLDSEDATKISLLYANQSPADIIVRDMLDAWARDHAQFSVWYTVDRPPAQGWGFSSGFISAEMIAEHLPAPADDVLVLMCGPPPMLKFACRPNLEKLGFDMKRQVGCF